MRSKKTADPLLFDQEIERTTRRIRRQLRERQNQEQPTSSSSSSTAEAKTTSLERGKESLKIKNKLRCCN